MGWVYEYRMFKDFLKGVGIMAKKGRETRQREPIFDMDRYDFSESVGIVFLAGVLYLSVCLLSYTTKDQTPFYYDSALLLVHNWGGRFGADFSAYLFHLIGAGSYALIGALSLVAYYFLAMKKIKRLYWASIPFMAVFVICVALLAQLYDLYLVYENAGGIVGYWLHKYLTYYCGFYGTAIIGWSTLWVSLVLGFRISVVKAVLSGAYRIVQSRLAFFFSKPC